MCVLSVLSPEFRRLPPALNGIVHHNVNRESWSIEASSYLTIGSASATDCVVNPTFGGPFFNPGDFGSASPYESRGLSPFGGSFLDPGALQGTLVPSCELLTFVSPDSVRGACAWLNSVGEVELFQYGVGRTLYGIKGTY